MIRQIDNLNIFQNKELFDIRSFVIVFTIYSLISIWLAHASYSKDQKISYLLNQANVLKSEYVLSKTILMTTTKQSNLLKRGESFGFFSPSKPVTTISFKYED